ncbi:MAG TPA: hypothetical protein VKB71_00270 [Rhizomicrobium sp.]|nr:hypothetical protein [Rhizomicrobium sp.]
MPSSRVTIDQSPDPLSVSDASKAGQQRSFRAEALVFYNDPAWLTHRHGVGEEAKPVVNALTAALNALATEATTPP